MTTKWRNTKVTENAGLLYVQTVINACKGVFNKIDGSNDVGIDGYLEFVQGDSLTGLCIGVQIKSGDSYQDKSLEQVVIQSDKNHFGYWQSHTLPIAVIVYIPSDDQAYWMDITNFQKNTPGLIDKGPYLIKINKAKVFNKESFFEFFEVFSKYKDLYTKEWNLARALKGIVDFKPKRERFDAIKSLFYFHRDCKETWYYLIQLFRRETDKDIQKALIFTMKHLISHGDIYWHKYNTVPDDIEEYARREITLTFKKEEVLKLLSHIDESGITRGSVGQDIYPLLDLITDKFEYLKQVILDRKTSDKVRQWAGVIAINDLQRNDLLRAIYFCDSMIDNFPESDFREWFQDIKQALREGGHVDFQG